MIFGVKVSSNQKVHESEQRGHLNHARASGCAEKVSDVASTTTEDQKTHKVVDEGI